MGKYSNIVSGLMADSAYGDSGTEATGTLARAGVSLEDYTRRVRIAALASRSDDPAYVTSLVQSTLDQDARGFGDALAQVSQYTGLSDFAGTLQNAYVQMGRDSKEVLDRFQKQWDDLSDNERAILRDAYGLNAPAEQWEGYASEHGIDDNGDGGGLLGDILGGVDFVWDNSLGKAHSAVADAGGAILKAAAAPQQLVTRLERAIYLDIRGGYDGWFGGDAWDEAGIYGGEGAYRKTTHQDVKDKVGFDEDLYEIAYELSLRPNDPRELTDIVDEITRDRLGIDEDVPVTELHTNTEYTQLYAEIYGKAADNQDKVQAGFEEFVKNKISPGRQLANLFIDDPTSAGYKYLSGAGDAAWTIFADPLLVAGKPLKLYRAGRYALNGADLATDLTKAFGNAEDIARVQDILSTRTVFDRVGHNLADATYRRNYFDEVNKIAGGNHQLRLGIVITDTFDADDVSYERLSNLYRFLNAQRGTKGAQVFTELVKYDNALRGVDIGTDGERVLNHLAKMAKKEEFIPTGNPAVDEVAKRRIDAKNSLVDAAFLRDSFDAPLRQGGLRTIEDFVGFFQNTVDGRTTLAAGVWGDYGRGYLELPYLSRSGIVKARAKLATENWLDNWKGSVFEIYKGLEPGDILQGKRASLVLARSKATVARTIHSAVNQLPREGAISLISPEGVDDFRRFLMLGLDNETSAKFLAQFASAYSPAAKRGIVLKGIEASMRGLGVAPETVGDVINGYGAYRKFYSIADRDVVKGVGSFGKLQRQAIYLSDLADEYVAIPNYQEMLAGIENMTKYQVVMGHTVNHRAVSWFFNTVWKPAVLLTPRFAFRMTGEEGLAWMARAGVFTPLRKSIFDPIRTNAARNGSLPWVLHPAGMIERKLRHWKYMDDWRTAIRAKAVEEGVSEGAAAKLLYTMQEGPFAERDIRFTKALNRGLADIFFSRNWLMKKVFGKGYQAIAMDVSWRHLRHNMSGTAYFQGVVGSKHMLAPFGRDADNVHWVIDGDEYIGFRREGGVWQPLTGEAADPNNPLRQHGLFVAAQSIARDSAGRTASQVKSYNVDRRMQALFAETLGVDDVKPYVQQVRRLYDTDSTFRGELDEFVRMGSERDDAYNQAWVDRVVARLRSKKRLTPEIEHVLAQLGKSDPNMINALRVRKSLLFDDTNSGVPVPRMIDVVVDRTRPTDGAATVTLDTPPDRVVVDLADPEWQDAMRAHLPALEDGTVRLWQIGRTDNRWYADVGDAEMINNTRGGGRQELRFVDLDIDTYEKLRPLEQLDDGTYVTEGTSLSHNQIRYLEREIRSVQFQPLELAEYRRREELVELAEWDEDAAEKLGLHLTELSRAQPKNVDLIAKAGLHQYGPNGDRVVGAPMPGHVRVLVPMLPEADARTTIAHAYRNGKLDPREESIAHTWAWQHGYDNFDEWLRDFDLGALPEAGNDFIPLGGIGHTAQSSAYDLADRWAELAFEATGRRYTGTAGWVDVPKEALDAARQPGDPATWGRINPFLGGDTGRVIVIPDRAYVKTVVRREADLPVDESVRVWTVEEALDELAKDATLDDTTRGAVNVVRDMISGGRLEMTDEGKALLVAMEDLDSELTAIGAAMWRNADPVELMRRRNDYYRKVYRLLDGDMTDAEQVAAVWRLHDDIVSLLPTRHGSSLPERGDPLVDALVDEFGENWHLFDSAGNPRSLTADELTRYKAVAQQVLDDTEARIRELELARRNQAIIDAGGQPEPELLTDARQARKPRTRKPAEVVPDKTPEPVQNERVGRGPRGEYSFTKTAAPDAGPEVPTATSQKTYATREEALAARAAEAAARKAAREADDAYVAEWYRRYDARKAEGATEERLDRDAILRERDELKRTGEQVEWEQTKAKGEVQTTEGVIDTSRFAVYDPSVDEALNVQAGDAIADTRSREWRRGPRESVDQVTTNVVDERPYDGADWLFPRVRRGSDPRKETLNSTADAIIFEGPDVPVEAAGRAPVGPRVANAGTPEAREVAGSQGVWIYRDPVEAGNRLTDTTKRQINEAHAWGARFYVTDELEDIATVEYLDSIGARYSIWHVGDRSKIDPAAGKIYKGERFKQLTPAQQERVRRQAQLLTSYWKTDAREIENTFDAPLSKLRERLAIRDRRIAAAESALERMVDPKVATVDEVDQEIAELGAQLDLRQRQMREEGWFDPTGDLAREQRRWQIRYDRLVSERYPQGKPETPEAASDARAKLEGQLAKLKTGRDQIANEITTLEAQKAKALDTPVPEAEKPPVELARRPGPGKGTPEGDTKDKAMREVADSAIVEIKTRRPSSTVTTRDKLPEPGDTSKVVMLARQNAKAHRGTDISDETKAAIRAAHERGARFVVGDMPGIDEPFVRYLDEIGARFTIYYSGHQPRIPVPERYSEPDEIFGYLYGEEAELDELLSLDLDNLRARVRAINSVEHGALPNPAKLRERADKPPFVRRRQWVAPGERWKAPDERAVPPPPVDRPDVGPPPDPWQDPDVDIRFLDETIQNALAEKFGLHWRSRIKDPDATFEVIPGTEGFGSKGVSITSGDPNEEVISIGSTYNDANRHVSKIVWEETKDRTTFQDGTTNYTLAAPVGNGDWTPMDADLLNVGAMRKGWYGPRYKQVKKELWRSIVNGFFDRYAHPMLAAVVRNPMFQEQLDRFYPQIEALLMPILSDPTNEARVLELAGDLGIDTNIDDLFRSLDHLHDPVARHATLSTKAFEDGVDPTLPISGKGVNNQWRFGEEPPQIITEIFRPILEAQDEYRKAFAAGDVPLSRVAELEAEISRQRKIADEALNTLSVYWHDRDKAMEHITNVTYQRAFNELVPLIDDHHFKSMLADDLRNLFPFWYAEEQFLKRWIKGIKKNPYAIRRISLMLHGLQTLGFIQKDEHDNDMYIVPGGSTLISAFTNILPFELLFGGGPQSVVGVDITGNLQHTLPGIGSEKIGQPQGSFLISIPLTLLANAIPEFDSFRRGIVGEENATKSIVEQVMPSHVAKLYNAFLSDPDQNKDVVGTTLNVLAQFEAAGLSPDEDASPHEQEVYLDRVKNWSRIFVAGKAILGLFTMATPQADFRNEFTPEFRELLKHVGDYEEAFNLLIKRYPDATPYTVFNTTTESGAYMPASQQTANWMHDNKTLIDEYPVGMPWLLPFDISVQSEDDHDGITYHQQVANEARQMRTPEEFYRELKVKASTGRWFKQMANFEKRLAFAATAEEKARIEDEKQLWSAVYKRQHPLFAEDIQSREGAARREQALWEVESLVRPGGVFGADPEYIGFRSMIQMVRQWQGMEQTYGSSDLEYEQKLDLRRDVYRTLAAYAGRRPEIRQFWLRNVMPLFDYTDMETALIMDDQERFNEIINEPEVSMLGGA